MLADPFSFIAGSICVFIASKDDVLSFKIIDYLSRFPLYKVKRVKSMKEADIELLTNPCHICLDDFTLESSSNYRLEFLEKYGKEFSTIVIAQDGSIEEGFIAAKHGAYQALPIANDMRLERLVDSMNDLFLRIFLIPEVGKLDDKLARICANVLFDQQPDTVSSWAAATDIDVTYLRRKWELWTKTKPKESLFLMALFKLAFKYYTLSHDKRPYYCKVFSRNLERMQNHFLCNRSRFINIIHGNVQSGNNFRSVGINSHIEIDTIECNYLRK